MKKYLVFLVLGVLVAVGLTFGQKIKKNPTADEILGYAVQSFSGVEDFSVTIDVELKMERMQIPPMHATMLFKRPDKVHFDSQGFLFLPKEGMALNPSFLQERYSTAGSLQDTLDGVMQYKLLLVAKDQAAHLLRLNVWINPNAWTIRKVETTPYEGRMLSLQFEYEKQEEKYWLLSKTVASFGSVFQTQGQNDVLEMKKQALEDAPKPPSRNGMVIIRYSNYKVNQKIDDSVFEKKETQGKK